ncbi:MAG: hypothetical protein ACE5OW_03050 [Candidatus Bathyarchaeia archaeon]
MKVVSENSNAKAFHYNVLPIGMVTYVTALAKGRLDSKTKSNAQKLVYVGITDAFDFAISKTS